MRRSKLGGLSFPEYSSPVDPGGGVGVGVGVGVGLGVGEGVGLGVGDGVGLGEGDGEGLGEGDGEGLGEGDGVGLGEGDGVGLGVGVGIDPCATDVPPPDSLPPPQAQTATISEATRNFLIGEMSGITGLRGTVACRSVARKGTCYLL
jgi:hypothetical protein